MCVEVLPRKPLHALLRATLPPYKKAKLSPPKKRPRKRPRTESHSLNPRKSRKTIKASGVGLCGHARLNKGAGIRRLRACQHIIQQTAFNHTAILHYDD